MIIKITNKTKTSITWYDDIIHSINSDKSITLLPSRKSIKFNKKAITHVMNDKGAYLSVLED